MRFLMVAILAMGVLSACGGGTGPAVMEFVEVIPAHPKIGEVVTVRFKLLDARGVPLAGQDVDFKASSASPNPGISLNPSKASSIKGSGFAETQLIASNRVNSMIVVATAGTKVVQSPPISFAGTVASGRQFTFQCGSIAGEASGGIHAIGAYDPARHLIAGVKVDCFAHAGDRNGDGVSGAIVSFLSEAGAIGPSESTTSDVIGNAKILYKTSLPLPADVGPETFTFSPANDLIHTGALVAPLWMHPFEWVENPVTLLGAATVVQSGREPRRFDPIRKKPDLTKFENNPRDNLVSMIAVTAGEEGFTDSNNNGTYDNGEVFDDLTEPFVDNNDNGTWDIDERFIDVDGDKQWDGKNEKWDANTLIWVQERLLWTGIPAEEDYADPLKPVFVSLKVVGGSPDITLRCNAGIPPGGLCAAAGPVAEALSYLADPWFNSMAQNADGDGCSIDPLDKPPVTIPGGGKFGSGVRFTYTAGSYFRFFVQDSRDPNAMPPGIPKRQFPIDFVIVAGCSFTASPQDGHVVKVAGARIRGSID